jgi:hypothetical protein
MAVVVAATARGAVAVAAALVTSTTWSFYPGVLRAGVPPAAADECRHRATRRHRPDPYAPGRAQRVSALLQPFRVVELSWQRHDACVLRLAHLRAVSDCNCMARLRACLHRLCASALIVLEQGLRRREPATDHRLSLSFAADPLTFRACATFLLIVVVRARRALPSHENCIQFLKSKGASMFTMNIFGRCPYDYDSKLVRWQQALRGGVR